MLALGATRTAGTPSQAGQGEDSLRFHARKSHAHY
jgi:hypothetical protein